MKNNRIIGLGLVRVIAIILVFSLHFLLNNGYYDLTFNSPSAFVLSGFNWLFLTCIGLFLLLTGYFGDRTKLDKNYFYRILKILISYLIISIICIIFRIFYWYEPIEAFKGILSIIDFKADGYAWYVEMYIGLYILMPFLNIIYDKFNNKKYLLGVFLFLTAVPPALRFVMPEWWGYDLLPNRWISLYPITYYFIGRYLKDNPLKISNWKKFLIIIGSILIETILCFVVYYGKDYPGSWFDFNEVGHLNLFTVIICVMIFSILYTVKLKNKFLSKVVSIISMVTLEMYLISWMIDIVIYNNLNLKFRGLLDYIINYFICVSLVFISSFVLAYFINKATMFIVKKIRPLYDRFFVKVNRRLKW